MTRGRTTVQQMAFRGHSGRQKKKIDGKEFINLNETYGNEKES